MQTQKGPTPAFGHAAESPRAPESSKGPQKRRRFAVLLDTQQTASVDTQQTPDVQCRYSLIAAAGDEMTQGIDRLEAIGFPWTRPNARPPPEVVVVGGVTEKSEEVLS